jgi:hypothetical protein
MRNQTNSCKKCGFRSQKNYKKSKNQSQHVFNGVKMCNNKSCSYQALNLNKYECQNSARIKPNEKMA